MNRGVIQTALTNKSLPLELDYRKPSMQNVERGFEDPAEARLTPQSPEWDLIEEFLCLLKAI